MMVPADLTFGSLARAFVVVINSSFPDAPGRCEHLSTPPNYTAQAACQKLKMTCGSGLSVVLGPDFGGNFRQSFSGDVSVIRFQAIIQGTRQSECGLSQRLVPVSPVLRPFRPLVLRRPGEGEKPGEGGMEHANALPRQVPGRQVAGYQLAPCLPFATWNPPLQRKSNQESVLQTAAPSGCGS